MKNDPVIPALLISACVLIVAMVGFVSFRDGCSNPAYREYMGPELCPTTQNK